MHIVRIEEDIQTVDAGVDLLEVHSNYLRKEHLELHTVLIDLLASHLEQRTYLISFWPYRQTSAMLLVQSLEDARLPHVFPDDFESSG